MDLLKSAFRSLRAHAAFSSLIVLLPALRATRVNPVDALRSE